MKKNKGITLIALVITIIVLLILVAVSIATLTGENGVLTKASKANKETDVAETKEQIKLELMGNFDEQGISYTNQDVIIAVKKITGKDIVEKVGIVQSQKGNDVDISDLWTSSNIVRFSIDGTFYEVKKGTTWEEYLSENNPDSFWLWYKPTDAIMYYVNDSGTNMMADWLVDEDNRQVYKNDTIKRGNYNFGEQETFSNSSGWRDIGTFGE